ncbi:MAG TPA: TonB-dependent receptor [Dyella sp.]|uniref:TonB-dependent receptor plug domain-containing protein n=1 Tax=Dyella sp. TaxID=1869338 RepID=UPI002B9159A9|nr:TonB-dependent receptor [Dyella sp.]HUB91163.1 TonB-dependent receptor [Dyella sp.]
MTRNKLALSLAGLLFAPIAGTAFAQSTPAATTGQDQSQNTKQLQTITVTGSAIPRIDTETPSPVTVITAQQIARSGYTTISDVVRSISADNSGSIPNAFTNGFAAGSSGVALRGLTVNSTLVLIDGQRAASYALSDDGQRSFVDLNTIPLAAVERIEVLKDGASSLYGADAIAGVVNIILRPSFQGVEGTADVGNSQHGGGFTKKATFLAGAGDLDKDHYNAYFSVQYERDNPIWSRDRDFPYNTNNLSSIGGPNPYVPGNGFGSTVGSITNPATGLLQPLRGCTPNTQLVTNSAGSYCYQDLVNQYTQVAPQMEQGGIYGRFTVKINDTTKAYLSASYMQSKSWAVNTPAQIQNSTPVNTNNITLPVGNPSNPFSAPALINYAFGDIPEGTNYTNHNMRLVGGVQGTMGDWNYNTTATINHTSLDTTQFGFINYNALITAINNGSYNFANPSSNSAAVRASLAPGYAKTSTSDLDSLDFNANRELWDLPGGPMGLALGAQVRHEAQDDPTLNPGFEFQGLGNATTKGSRDVAGAYGELDLPLLESLEADVSGRFDHYSDVGNNFSPKIGLKWKPLDWVAVRGTYSKGFRAPSFAENGSSSAQGFVNVTPPASFQALHGGNAYSSSPYAISEYTLANRNIKPEKANSFTFGVVLQPTSWLNASLDYYNIRKSNVITAPDYGSALAEYWANGGTVPGVTITPDLADPQHPGALARPAVLTGEYINANSLKTTGLDLDIQGHWNFGAVKYISELQGTQIFQWKMILPGGIVQSYVGTQGPYNLSSGAGTPRTKGSWSNTVMYGPLTVTGTLYYTSGYQEIAEDVGVGPGSCLFYNAAGTAFMPSNCHVGSFYDFDLTGSYDINDHLAVTASLMNAFDRKAPFDPANYAGNNYNPTYSQAGVVGRFWNVGVKVKF